MSYKDFILTTFDSCLQIQKYKLKLLFYGPVKPHLGHLYGRPNFRHFWHRQIMISPQFGHGSFTAWVPGWITLWQLLHFGISMFDMSSPRLNYWFDYL